jgi:paraquat-inducible protein B
MNDPDDNSRSLAELPRARIEKNWKTRFIWLVPIGAAALASWFIYSNVVKGGPTLHIYFEDAAGVQQGKSQLKYRGAEIGEVRNVKLTKDHKQVDVTVAVRRSAESIAREGSRFWIVKAELGAMEIRGLRTIVSGDYITVEPGEGKPRTKFIGLGDAPVIEPQGALRIVLLAEKLGSVKVRSPVFYRGIQAGQVAKCELGPKSQTINITIDIDHHYAPLVRMNSKFWNAGGIHATLSLSGLNIAAQSAEALISGGIDFATPDAIQKEAPPQTAFRLYDKAEDQWLGWAPVIELNGPEKGPSS